MKILNRKSKIFRNYVFSKVDVLSQHNNNSVGLNHSQFFYDNKVCMNYKTKKDGVYKMN